MIPQSPYCTYPYVPLRLDEVNTASAERLQVLYFLQAIDRNFEAFRSSDGSALLHHQSHIGGGGIECRTTLPTELSVPASPCVLCLVQIRCQQYSKQLLH